MCKEESPAVTDKPARRESVPKFAPIQRDYNVVADNTGQFVASEIYEIPRNSLKIQTYRVQGHPKVIDLGVFLLVINSNFSPICYRFRDIDA